MNVNTQGVLDLDDEGEDGFEVIGSAAFAANKPTASPKLGVVRQIQTSDLASNAKAEAHADAQYNYNVQVE